MIKARDQDISRAVAVAENLQTSITPAARVAHVGIGTEVDDKQRQSHWIEIVIAPG